jgi:hypothetical protein
VLVGAAVVGACGEDVVTTPTTPPATAQYSSAHFVVMDFVGLDTALVDSMLARLEADYLAVTTFLPGFPAPDTVTVRILPGWSLPSATLGEPEITQFVENLVLDYNVHLLVHLLTGYGSSEFLEEGLAVYATELLVPESRTVEPYRGQVPHAWMSLFGQHGTVISFDVVYSARNVRFEPSGSSADASAWQLYVQGGSFTRWVFEDYGRDVWFRLYNGEDPETLLTLSVPEIEASWLAAAQALYPNPLPCAEALGTVGTREEFWCALAEGG